MKRLKSSRLAVLGLGKMGGILARSFLDRGLLKAAQLEATVKRPQRTEILAKELGIAVGADNVAAVRRSRILILAVKPGTVMQVVREIAPELTDDHLIISIAASVTCTYIERLLERPVRVVRAMPNTPCSVGVGMTGICAGKHALPEDLELARALFEAVGKTVTLEEKHMDAVTGLSASGPAFIYIILESLAEAGVKVGLPRDVATLLAAQTVRGAAEVVLATGSHPALLKDSVTTPAGCTIDGILELEEGKLRVTLVKAVMKATQRAGELVMTDL
ncbi:MAG TPA: pyrroline-5-carboxylate reductase [Acidobacteriota bacterium]|nr:pyrroline-5-carboxylate reductase [Acidobacteriota bacterium]